MKDPKAIKKQTLLRAAAQSTLYHANKAGHELSETAETSVQGGGEDYAESKVQSGIADSGNIAGNVTLEAVRLPYAKYRAIQGKRAAEISTPLDSVDLPHPHDVENPVPPSQASPLKGQRRKIQMSFIKKEAIQDKYIRAAEKKSVLRKRRTAPVRHRSSAVLGSKSLSKATDSVSRFVKKAVEKIKQLLVQAVKAVSSALLAILPAGAVVVLCILFIGIIAALLASPMGILFAGETNDPNNISISSITAEANEAFGQAINDIVTAHPECSEVQIQYDYEDGHTWASYWPEVLAVFAVQSNLNSDMDVLIIDDAKKQLLLDTFWMMHNISSEVTSEEIEVEVPDDTETDQDEDSDTEDSEPSTHTETQTVYTLNITVSSRTVEELAADFDFSDDQNSILQQLLSSEMRPYLAALAASGGLLPGGALMWPLPGYSHISTHFGVPDAFGKPGHKGIDIPAPEGTPIYAAHGGTVLIATESDSYGNQILLDSGDGTSTRYAHMIGFTVSAGEAVIPGQIIGYVGSTGASTGNHLHFEVMINGTLVDPLTVVSVG